MMNPFEQMTVPGGVDRMMPLGKEENPNKAVGKKELGANHQEEPFSKVLQNTRHSREETSASTESSRKKTDETVETESVKFNDEKTTTQSRALFREDLAHAQKTLEIPKGIPENLPEEILSKTPKVLQNDVKSLSITTPEGEVSLAKATLPHFELLENQNQAKSTSQAATADLSKKAPSSAAMLPTFGGENTVEEVEVVKRSLPVNAAPTIAVDESDAPAITAETNNLPKTELLGDEVDLPEPAPSNPMMDEVVLEYEAREAAPALRYKTTDTEVLTQMKPTEIASETFKIDESLVFAGGRSDHQKGAMGGSFLDNPSVLFSPAVRGQDGEVGVQSVKSQFQTLLDAGVTIPDEREVLRQVGHQLRAWRPGQEGPIRFLLEPKQLGMLQIEILLQEKGVRAHMVTADPFVKTLLQENQGFLQDGLKAQGLHIAQFSVDLGDRREFYHQDGTPSFSKRALPVLDAGETPDAVLPVMYRPGREAGQLSIYI